MGTIKSLDDLDSLDLAGRGMTMSFVPDACVTPFEAMLSERGIAHRCADTHELLRQPRLYDAGCEAVLRYVPLGIEATPALLESPLTDDEVTDLVGIMATCPATWGVHVPSHRGATVAGARRRQAFARSDAMRRLHDSFDETWERGHADVRGHGPDATCRDASA